MTFAKTCWACGSTRFIETVSREYCPDCGIECLYHGSGANEKYQQAHAFLDKLRAEEDEKRFEELYKEQWGEDYK